MAAIHKHFYKLEEPTSTTVAQEVTPHPRNDVATMAIDEMNMITSYEESLLQVAEDYVASLPECIHQMDYDIL